MKQNSLLLKRGIAFLVDLYWSIIGITANFNNIINNDKADDTKYLFIKSSNCHHSSIAQSFITRILLFIYTFAVGSDSRKKTNGS